MCSGQRAFFIFYARYSEQRVVLSFYRYNEQCAFFRFFPAAASSGRFSVSIARYSKQRAFFSFYCPLQRAAGVSQFLFHATARSGRFFIARYSEQRGFFNFYCPLVYKWISRSIIIGPENAKIVLVLQKIRFVILTPKPSMYVIASILVCVEIIIKNSLTWRQSEPLNLLNSRYFNSAKKKDFPVRGFRNIHSCIPITHTHKNTHAQIHT